MDKLKELIKKMEDEMRADLNGNDWDHSYCTNRNLELIKEDIES